MPPLRSLAHLTARFTTRLRLAALPGRRHRPGERTDLRPGGCWARWRSARSASTPSRSLPGIRDLAALAVPSRVGPRRGVRPGRSPLWCGAWSASRSASPCRERGPLHGRLPDRQPDLRDPGDRDALHRAGALALNWGTWWIGDLSGMLIATPIASTLIGRPRSEWAPRRIPVGVTLALVTAFLALADRSRWNAGTASGRGRRSATTPRTPR